VFHFPQGQIWPAYVTSSAYAIPVLEGEKNGGQTGFSPVAEYRTVPYGRNKQAIHQRHVSFMNQKS
jgi:hypothetical protein